MAFLTVSRGGSKITKKRVLVHDQVCLGKLLSQRWWWVGGVGVGVPFFPHEGPSNTYTIKTTLVPT